jgi:hypothetical protein
MRLSGYKEGLSGEVSLCAAVHNGENGVPSSNTRAACLFLIKIKFGNFFEMKKLLPDTSHEVNLLCVGMKRLVKSLLK